MNDNFEPNGGEQDEPFVKKAAKFSAFIYLGLAITVVIVATVGIFSISYDYDTSVPQISVPDISDFSIPEINPPLNEPSSEAPVAGEESGVDAEVDARVMFYRPVTGEIIKCHDLEKLVFSETMSDYRVHSGIDISASVGATVVAFTDGKIISVEDDYFYGTTVAISHEGGMVSYYMNLDPKLADDLKVGSDVLAGQPIGVIGGTARIESADKPHLHFELTLNGDVIDPEPELP